MGIGQPGDCVGACALNVAAYIRNGFSTATAQLLTEAQQKAQVDAGQGYYTSKSCVICHGNDGQKSVGGGKSLLQCSVCDSWDMLRDYIDDFMPLDNGAGFGPQSCDMECAARTADWIWVVVNGGRLTTDGGVPADQTVDRTGFNTLRVKSFASISAEFQRVFGAVPAGLIAAKTAFRETPKYWYEEQSLGAVTLNVLANAAVESCSDETMPPFNAAAIRTKCGEWAERMWLRPATADELDSCVEVATVTTADLPTADKRLVFACASMMLSMPTLTF